jgi:hypothetical protein
MPSITDSHVIPLSKTKLIFLVLGALVLAAAGVWLYMNADQFPEKSPLFAKLVGLVGVIFSGAGAAYGFLKLFDHTPGLIVDSKGIFDNSSGISAGLIPWSDITGFSVSSIQGQRFLSIEVRNPDLYIQRASGLKRMLVSLNARYFGGPIHISSNALKIPFDQLLRIVGEAHVKHGVPD